VLPGLLDAASCARWLAAIDARRAALPPGHEDLQATSGSLRLTALGAGSFDALLQRLQPAVQARWPGACCLPSQCWARCQWPQALRPRGEHPHHWHQDGALGARFDGPQLPPPRPLLTLWLPLLPCGDDAPSLEWLPAQPDGLLPPHELADERLAQRFTGVPRAHARLAAGDALLFGGLLLHRTHVTASMTRRRVSVELRFEPAR
jgi:Phytanoyl-CoA dioxygenase (PhyH)